MRALGSLSIKNRRKHFLPIILLMHTTLRHLLSCAVFSKLIKTKLSPQHQLLNFQTTVGVHYEENY